MTTVIERCGKLVVVAMLSLSLGLHWAFLQTVAWAGMVAHYSQTAPISAALRSTFDGKHPCALCTIVKAGKAAEKHSDQAPAGWVKKLEGNYQVALEPVGAPPRFDWSPMAYITEMQPRAEPPLSPPPRLA